MRKIIFLLWLGIFILLIYVTKAQNSNENRVLDASKKNKNVLSGLTFKVPAYDYAPLFFIKKNSNGNFSYEGVAPEFIGLMAGHFNFKISWIHVNRSEVESTSMSTTTFRMLTDNEVDLTSYPLERKMSYLEKADLLLPFWIADYILMQPWPEEESRLLIPIRPFTPFVWLCLLGSVLVFAMSSSIFIYFLVIKKNDGLQQESFINTFIDQMEYILSIITLQGSHGKHHSTDRTSLRILVGSWLLAMIVVVYAYQGVLMSILSVPKLKPTIDSLEELVEQHKYKLTIERSSSLTQLFMEATSGTYKQIKDSLDKNLLFGDILKGIDNVANHNCIYPGVMELVQFFISNDFKRNHKCRMTAASKPLAYFMSYHFAVAKNSPYTEMFNQEFMLYFVETGLNENLRSKMSPRDRPCRTDVKPTGKMSAFKLRDFSPAFFLYAVGVSISCLALFLELIIGRASRYAICKIKKKSNENTFRSHRIVVVKPKDTV